MLVRPGNISIQYSHSVLACCLYYTVYSCWIGLVSLLHSVLTLLCIFTVYFVKSIHGSKARCNYCTVSFLAVKLILSFANAVCIIVVEVVNASIVYEEMEYVRLYIIGSEWDVCTLTIESGI